MLTPAPHPIDAAYWRGRLTEALAKHRVPGAALGFLHGGAIVDVAAGVLSKATLVEATPDSVFQTGSITKVWTTTVVMHMVDEGLIELDTPVVDVLSGFSTADPDVAKEIKVRHLLTHTSGIDGDIFLDTGRGDDCLEKYVATLSDATQIHPVGRTYSYCNSAFTVAGRMIEVLTGMTWDAALRTRIVEPLQLSATVTLPEEAILHRAAVGHLTLSGNEPRPAANWVLPRSGGPAGRVTARVRDVLEFTRMHLSHGSAPNGAHVLSPASATAMATKRMDVPDNATADSCGLGWHLYDWNGHRLIGHDGGTIGQRAFLRASPERDFGVCLLTNGGDAVGLYHELFAEAFKDLAGISMPPPFAPPAEPIEVVNHTSFVGHYSRAGVELEVMERAGGLALRTTATGLFAELFPGQDSDTQLIPVRDNQFAAKRADNTAWSSVYFYNVDDVSLIHLGGRAAPRVGVS